MNYLSLEHISKSFGDNILFEDIELQISKGQKVALVARNGAGKTTLLNIAAGTESAEGEKAKVELAKNTRFYHLKQDPQFYSEHSILDAVLDTDNPMADAVKAYELAMLKADDQDAIEKAIHKMDELQAWDFESRVKETLYKLKLTRLNQQVSHLSGGQKKRLALAQMFINEPDFIILDEPTNHLDIDIIEWLEEYLSQPNLTLLMVTHDRYFLDQVCNNIVEIDNQRLYRYSGNYTAFLIKKSERHDNEGVVYDKNRKLFKKELDWARRMPKARGTKAKSRLQAFHELKDELAQRRQSQELQIDIKGQRLGKKILEAHHISKSYDDQKIVEGFSYKFKKWEKVGIVGPNGAGKSTLLSLLTKQLKPDEGKVVVGGNTVFGFYSQDGIATKSDKRVIDVIRDIAEFIPLDKGRKLTAEQVLERFLFDRKQQQVFVSKLSGGERRRLYLLSVLMENPNFLILDEPTNDLDIMTLNILEDFLIDFPGCVMIVSHDRYFLDKVVDHLFIFQGDGQIKDFNGDYTSYRLWLKEQPKTSTKKESAKTETPAASSETEKALSYEDRKILGRLEKQIEKLENKKKELEGKFTDPNLDPDKIQDLAKELDDVKAQIEDKEMEWLEMVG